MATNRSDAGTSTATTLLLVAGGISAGVHAGLAPEHLHEWLPLGVAFIAYGAAVAFAIAALTHRPASPWPPRLLGWLFAGVVAAYALTRVAALAPLDPRPEPLDALGVCTSALEAAGCIVALRFGRLAHLRPIALTTGGKA